MEHKEYHEQCRASLGNPRAMLEPAWFRVGIDSPPKGFGLPAPVTVETVDTVAIGNAES
jgi:hypothetical protein